MIEVKEGSKHYGNKSVFEAISFKFENEIYWLTGGNGIGKSVFCRCLVGLEEFSGGKLEGELGNVLFLPDTSVADNWLTIDENLDLMQYYFKINMNHEKLEEIKRRLEITEGKELASRVSVGTSMKVGLFLLFVEQRWQTIVLDETLSHVDEHIKTVILEELEKRKQEGACIVIINHGELSGAKSVAGIQKLYLDKQGIRREE